MKESWIRRALYFAAAWNILGAASALADPARHFVQMYTGTLSMNDPLQAFFFRATWINVMAWGVAYLLGARVVKARSGILVAGGAGKLAYFAACVSLYQSGQGSALLLATGLLDVAFAALFAKIVWRMEVAGPWKAQSWASRA